MIEVARQLLQQEPEPRPMYAKFGIVLAIQPGDADDEGTHRPPLRTAYSTRIHSIATTTFQHRSGRVRYSSSYFG